MRPQDRARFGPVTATLKNGQTVTVRMAEPTDTDIVAEFYSVVPRKDWRFYSAWPMTRESAQTKVADRADADNFVCALLISTQGRVAGYAWYNWKDATSRDSVFGICIRTEFQECGAGQVVMRRLLEVAREIGPPVMSLTVQLANTRAVALYQKMGFCIVRQQMRPQVAEFPPEPEYYMEQPTR
jgi:ribosomal protein S18 acetylase RimI-like enzyme